MEKIANPILTVIGALFVLVFVGFGLISLHERERRAAIVAGFVAVLGGAIFFGATLLPYGFQSVLLLITASILAIGLLLSLLPIGNVQIGKDTPKSRVDERDIMFARWRLEPGSPEYESYYHMRPEHIRGDELTRSKPGLLSKESRYADAILFASPKGSFFLTEALHNAVDGPVAVEKENLPTHQMTTYIKDLTMYFGALDVGITELRPYHVYSHIGRGAGTYGATIPMEHQLAIAFTVEMDHGMIAANPYAPGVMESARQYVESARVAVSLAAAIRHLGYPARAHIDGNYRVIAPLVARDAGLGEIGRMGLLMTKRHGPRVRLGVVTTNLQLNPDSRIPDPSVIDFCNICNKCARNCPSRSIPFGTRQEIDGALRWKIDPDTCFRYWNVIGTDCGVCMTVCPYSHPNAFSHNLIRWGVRKSGFLRRIALWLDDLFYGKQPTPRAAPKWTQIRSSQKTPE